MIGSERVFVCGASGSGKTYFLARHFLPRAKRLLIVDQIGEWTARYPDVPMCDGYAATLEELKRVARLPEWVVIAYLDPEEVMALASQVLLPIGQVGSGYAASVGGMGLVLDEVDVLVPIANAPAPLRSLWRRSRHGGLSVYAATQRAGSVSKEVTSQCRWLGVLRQHERNDAAYLASVIDRDIVRAMLPELGRIDHSVFLWDTARRVGWLMDADGAVIRSTHAAQQDMDL